MWNRTNYKTIPATYVSLYFIEAIKFLSIMYIFKMKRGCGELILRFRWPNSRLTLLINRARSDYPHQSFACSGLLHHHQYASTTENFPRFGCTILPFSSSTSGWWWCYRWGLDVKHLPLLTAAVIWCENWLVPLFAGFARPWECRVTDAGWGGGCVIGVKDICSCWGKIENIWNM